MVDHKIHVIADVSLQGSTVSNLTEDQLQLESDDVLCTRLWTHREIVIQSMNLSALVPCLHNKGLIDLQSEIADNCRPNKERAECLFTLVMEKGAEARIKFLQALQKEDRHLGHKLTLIHI